MSPESGRMPLIDALKGIAAQIILLHHLVSYGPLAESLGRQFPLATGLLFDYGRMVVQVFLVIAGFLAAKALAPELRPRPANPVLLIWKRYLRLAPAFIAAMALAVAAAAVARQWTASDAVPAAPTLLQFLAHALMLHGVVDVPSLSAGVWYVAIDLQLYALFVILLTLGGTTGSLIAAPLLVATGVRFVDGGHPDRRYTRPDAGLPRANPHCAGRGDGSGGRCAGPVALALA